MNGSRIGVLVCAFLVAAVSIQAPGELQLVDEVVATVDKEVILYSEIVSIIAPELENIRKTASSQSEYDRRTDKLIRDALDEAIESRVLYLEARNESILVSDDIVEEEIDKLRSRYPNNEAFMEALHERGESLSDYRVRTRNLFMARILANEKLRLLEEEVVVSEEDILQHYQDTLAQEKSTLLQEAIGDSEEVRLQYYHDNRSEYWHPERVHVRQIQISLLPDATPKERADALTRLEALREAIMAGADFEDLAKVNSQALGAEEGGIMGWQLRDDLISPLDETAFSLEVGDTSKVLVSQFGMHLLRVDEREEAGLTPFEEVRLSIEPGIRDQLVNDRYEKWLGDLREQSSVRIFL